VPGAQLLSSRFKLLYSVLIEMTGTVYTARVFMDAAIGKHDEVIGEIKKMGYPATKLIGAYSITTEVSGDSIEDLKEKCDKIKNINHARSAIPLRFI
jgi:hypothetical protein